MKLTLNLGKPLALVTLLALFFLSPACKRQIIQPENRSTNSLSIAEAKSYFESTFKQTSGKNANRLTSANNENQHDHEPTMEDIMNSRKAIWESAYQSVLANGEAVKVPLDFGKTLLVTNQSKNEVVPFGALNYLFMYKDSVQKIHTEWVTLFPDESWLDGNRSQYNGRIEVKTWDGTLIKQYNYSKLGSVAEGVNLSSKKLSSQQESANTTSSDNIPTAPNVICITIANSSKCTCPDKSHCDLCWQCTSNVCQSFPTAPETPVIDAPITGGAGHGGGVGGGGGHVGGPDYSDYTPSNCNPDPNYTVPNYPAPGGGHWMLPCAGPGSVPTPQPILNVSIKTLTEKLNLNDAEVQFIGQNPSLANAIQDYLNANGHTPESKEIGKWAIGYLIANPGVNVDDFKNEFLRTTEVVADPAAVDWTSDPDNQVYVDLDQTVYQPYQDNQPWPTIERVIPFEKFVPIRKMPNDAEKYVNCLILAKEQLGKVGYTCSGYLPGSQTFQTYDAVTGIDKAKTQKAIAYLISSLSKGIPVLIGVDNRAGSPNDDDITDHFIVVVGMGTDSKGKYIQFMDSATDNRSEGASFNNRLYYNGTTGKITGQTSVKDYRNNAGMHDYIVTQVRKSIKK